ncbi:hypothetical protein LA080_010206 [Diaporthe eres]|nr:hypothetical protein LA080_010206 [Diaporthe eres]
MEKLEAQRSLRSDGIFPSLDILLANRAQVDKSHYLALWHEFQHGLKRILSLQDSLAVIAAAAREWPELFKGVTVHFLQSSCGKAYRLQRVDHLETFLRRLGLDDHTTEKAMSRHGLSREINKDIQGDPYKQNKRSVHAEIQLWAHIRRTSDFVPFHPGRPHTSKGAANTSVIGVSKLTCRLCHWLFQNVDSHRVVIRPSSWNVYHRWAIPSLPKDPDITRRLHNELADEISRVLAGGEVQRTETDTDSAPNSAGIFFVPGESSCDSSDLDNSGIWSHVGWSTSSTATESDSDRWKADSE